MPYLVRTQMLRVYPDHEVDPTLLKRSWQPLKRGASMLILEAVQNIKVLWGHDEGIRRLPHVASAGQRGNGSIPYRALRFEVARLQQSRHARTEPASKLLACQYSMPRSRTCGFVEKASGGCQTSMRPGMHEPTSCRFAVFPRLSLGFDGPQQRPAESSEVCVPIGSTCSPGKPVKKHHVNSGSKLGC